MHKQLEAKPVSTPMESFTTQLVFAGKPFLDHTLFQSTIGDHTLFRSTIGALQYLSIALSSKSSLNLCIN